MATNPSIITRNVNQLSEPTGNVYESLAIVAKRARQMAQTEKEEINAKLAEFSTGVDNLEEVVENREQIEISRQMERQAKPAARALEEFLEGKTYFRRVEASEIAEAAEVE